MYSVKATLRPLWNTLPVPLRGLIVTMRPIQWSKNGFAFAGKNAYRVEQIISVRELIDSLREEYDQVALQPLGS